MHALPSCFILFLFCVKFVRTIANGKSNTCNLEHQLYTRTHRRPRRGRRGEVFATLYMIGAMTGENRQLVTNEPAEFEK